MHYKSHPGANATKPHAHFHPCRTREGEAAHRKIPKPLRSAHLPAATSTNRAAKHVPSSTTKPAAQCSTIPGRWLLEGSAPAERNSCNTSDIREESIWGCDVSAASENARVLWAHRGENHGCTLSRRIPVLKFWTCTKAAAHSRPSTCFSQERKTKKKPGCGISMMRQRLFAPGGDAAADILLAVWAALATSYRLAGQQLAMQPGPAPSPGSARNNCKPCCGRMRCQHSKNRTRLCNTPDREVQHTQVKIHKNLFIYIYMYVCAFTLHSIPFRSITYIRLD